MPPRHRWALAISLLALPQLSTAEPAGDKPAAWLKKPTRNDLVAVWPRQALRDGVGAKVALKCTVTAAGTLRDCLVASEKPAGRGFGAAALALTPQFLFSPALKAGVPVDGEVTIPIEFPRTTPRRDFGPDGDPAFGMVRAVRGQGWEAAPEVADLVGAYPEKARAAKVAGRVVLNCRIGRGGALAGCSTLREQPAGYGFARAARSLIPKFRHPDRDAAGASLVGAAIQTAVVFSPETLDPAEPLIGKPSWVATPDPLAFAKSFPQAADKAGVTMARVSLDCRVVVGGALVDCRVLREDPPGLGFGPAALSVAGGFRLSVWSEEGLPTVGGRVTVPIRYELSGARPSRLSLKRSG